MTTVNTEWMVQNHPEIWHHEQAQVVHQLDVRKEERQHF